MSPVLFFLTTVINYQTLSSLKQHLRISQFLVSQKSRYSLAHLALCLGSNKAKIKVSVRLHSLLEALGKNILVAIRPEITIFLLAVKWESLSSPRSPAVLDMLLHLSWNVRGLLSSFLALHFAYVFFCCTSLTLTKEYYLLLRAHVIDWAHLNNQYNLPILSFITLIIFVKALLLIKVT